MTWRGSTTPSDRFFACLPYLLPLAYSLPFASYLFMEFPDLKIIFMPLFPILLFMGLFPYGLGGLIIFFCLYLLVVRNESISHFIRFNAMQAILLDIALFLCGLILGIFPAGTIPEFILETLYNTLFLGIVAAVVYAVVQSIRGKYAEIPLISDAVYMQVR